MLKKLPAVALLWLLPHLLLVLAGGDGRSNRVSVAVIGAGIGGSAASHFLREALDEELQAKIVVFDAAEKVGGRTDVSEILSPENSRTCTRARYRSVELLLPLSTLTDRGVGFVHCLLLLPRVSAALSLAGELIPQYIYCCTEHRPNCYNKYKYPVAN